LSYLNIANALKLSYGERLSEGAVDFLFRNLSMPLFYSRSIEKPIVMGKESNRRIDYNPHNVDVSIIIGIF
jgi:hypothetical protein